MPKLTPTISGIRFIPIRRVGSHVGFVSFLYDDNLAIKDVAVHQHAGKDSYRLVYPKNKTVDRDIVYPVNAGIGALIEQEVNCYLKANCKMYL